MATKEPVGKGMKPVVDKLAIAREVGKRFQAVPFDVPGYDDVTVMIAMLKRHERESIIAAVYKPDGTWDNLLQNRMACSMGLVEPKITVEELLDYPDSFIDPIASEVWKMSNEYQNTRSEAVKKGESDPFPKTSGSSIGSLTDSDASLAM